MSKPIVSINISGPSNSGKSTLMKTISTLLINRDFYDLIEETDTITIEDEFHIIKINTTKL